MSYKWDNEEYSLYGYLLTVINIGQLNKYLCVGSFDHHRYLAKKYGESMGLASIDAIKMYQGIS